MKRIGLLIPGLLIFALLAGQDKNFKRIFLEAEYYSIAGEYESAVRSYENLLSIDPNNANLNFLCAYNYMKSGGDIPRIISLLEKAGESADPSYREGSYKERNAPMDALFLLGRSYHINNHFDKAIETYTRYSNGLDKKDFAEIEYVNAHIKACELGKSMVHNPVSMDLDPLGGNLDFTWDVKYPVISGDGNILVFMAGRNNRTELMMSAHSGDEWSKSLAIHPQIGLTGNVRPSCLSFDGKELYLILDDYYNMDIYVSYLRDGRWSRAEKLDSPVNTRYSESHASVSADGTRLYFTSDRKGGIGGLDIYVSERTAENGWGEPLNLGRPINTYYNEDSPFLSDNDTRLFFSSQGHNTMGGYDIFRSSYGPEGNWETPVNMGYPLNTSDDDLYFNPGWKPGQAIYAGKFSGDRNYSQIHRVSVTPDEDPVRKPDEELLADKPDTVKAKQESASTTSIGIYYILNNILFDYNQATLNERAMRDVERIYILMRKYPEIGIELTGHTDAVGPAEYNMILSDQRARSVADYLVTAGIGSDRISLMAAGETDPVAINQYEDGSDAPEGRELNRHVSIRITHLSSDHIRVSDMFVPDDLIPREDKEYTVLLFQSAGRVGTTPEKFVNEQVSMISTDHSYLYTAGQFRQRADAVAYLNEVIDQGYPDARILERRDLEQLLRTNSLSDPFSEQKYTIQFMALKQARDISYFRDLNQVRRYDCRDGLYRYVTGEYNSIKAALNAMPEVRRKGYSQTIIMPCSRYDAMVKANR